MIEARAVAANREAFAKELESLEVRRRGALAAFEAVADPARLAAAVEAAGALVASPGSGERTVGGAVRFRIDAPVAGVMAMLDRLGEAGLPVRLESLKSDQIGCAGALSGLPLPSLPASATMPSASELPPRPLWPPEASRWDRVQGDLAQLTALRAELGPLSSLRERMEEVRALTDAAALARRHSVLVAQAVIDAVGAGASEANAVAFTDPKGYGVRVVAPGTGGKLADLLGRRGAVTTEGEALRLMVEVPTTEAVARRLVEQAAGR